MSELLAVSTMDPVEGHRCHECDKQFADEGFLERHKKRMHAIKIKLKCDSCLYSTFEKGNLLKHLKSHTNYTRSTKMYPCPLCDTYRSPDRRQMTHHYTEIHEIDMEIENLEFKSKRDFMSWKADTEKSEICRFVTSGGAHKSKTNVIFRHFRCFRDGFYVSIAKGLRHRKSNGFLKIDAVCPAFMKMVHNEITDVVRVKYCRTHVGHDVDLKRLTLTKEEKDEIAQKIAQNVPFNVILDGIQNSVNSRKSERLSLLTRKDLHNIVKSYNLNNNSVTQSNKCTSVESWIHQMKEETNIIRFYKAQGSVSQNYSYLREDDFVLIIANDAQLDVLKNYGPNCICFDNTRGANQYGFELTTVLVLDELKQGFPSAFLISSRTDSQIVSLFASVLKLSLKRQLETLVLMSDITDIFYDGWCDVMPQPGNWLFCKWHVDRAWRDNLDKISCTEKKSVVHQKLTSLLEETNEDEFSARLAQVIEMMKDDPETVDFGEYFENEFSHNYTSWAFSLQYCGVDANERFEKVHKELKRIYLKGSQSRKLDKALHGLMRCTSNKLNYLTVKTVGELNPKIVDIRQKHRKSLEMNDCVITNSEEGWSLSSNSERYDIVKSSEVDICDCKLKCDECSVCVHSFKCSCSDSSMKYNMCKHIHRLCSFLRDNVEQPSQAGEDDVDDCTTGFDVSAEEWMLPITVNVNEEKRKLLQQFLNALNKAKSESELDIVRKAIVPIIPSIEANRLVENMWT